MSARRVRLIMGEQLRANLRGPMIWILLALLVFTMWGLASGNVGIQAGDATVGGKKAFITSEFALAQTFTIVITLMYSFFLAVAAGMAVIRDDEHRISEILHATPLRPAEYIWGKYFAVLTLFFGVLGAHLVTTIVVNHVVPNPENEEYRGPFSPANYLIPVLIFGVPFIVFLSGVCFLLGERSRRPIAIFLFPVALIVLEGFFFWDWSPGWLDPRINRAIMLLDPGGFRWLNETWLKVDRGVDFYNHARIGYDVPFLLSRAFFLAVGLVCVAYSQLRFAARLRGSPAPRRRWFGLRRPRPAGAPIAADPRPATALPSLVTLGMRSSPPGFLGAAIEIARTEMRELRSHPGLYLFVPLILLQTIGSSLLALGAFDTPLLLTPGTLAVRMMNTLTLLVSLLLLFYQVESLRRERSTGFGSILYAAPARSLAILAGKTAANGMVGVVVILAAFLGGFVALLIQGRVRISLGPFVLVWGLLLVPTYILWCSFVTFLFALTRNRYTTYGIALAALILTGYLQFRGKMNWVGNWDLWDAVLWTDMGRFEIDRRALLLNRVMVLGLSIFFLVVAVRLFPRRDLDPARIAHRLSAPSLARIGLRLSPLVLVPVVAGSILWYQVNQGFQGKAIEKRQKDYWKHNLATWKDAPLPSLTSVELDLVLEPSTRRLKSKGTYLLVNEKKKPIAQIPLTGGALWEDVAWTLDGEPATPEDRRGLYVLKPSAPLAPGGQVRIGFSFESPVPKGITKNGGGTPEFLLPSGIVLTSFRPTFAPLLGYQEDIGVKEEDNRYEPRVYPEDYYKEVNEPAFVAGSWVTTKITVTAPAEYTLNSVGTLTSEKVEGGLRTAVWESDHPVRFFNVVAGKWDKKQGKRSTVYYHPGHPYNIDEISRGLDASIEHYSEWFYPYPWKELKISEFPALAYYAQGFPTNITFSEGIGFLTRSNPKSELAFMVTAHEAAHQWWGNILMPGKGPGGDILSEGMSHFSTILLMERVKGERERIEFCKGIETRYGDRRRADSERPMVKIDGSRSGDETVTYDKGGWVFWMLANLMGREAALEGMRDFIVRYKDGPDYPLLEDFVDTMRAHAPDQEAYDAFVKQWFFDVVVPEYTLSEVELETSGDSASEAHPARTASAAEPRDGGSYVVTFRIKNRGKGRMPVEIAATSGERFAEDGSAGKDYRESRVRVVLGADEVQDLRIEAPFKPDKLLVDPDAMVLQLGRKAAIARL